VTWFVSFVVACLLVSGAWAADNVVRTSALDNIAQVYRAEACGLYTFPNTTEHERRALVATYVNVYLRSGAGREPPDEIQRAAARGKADAAPFGGCDVFKH
jgi:hypothetical protein